MKSLIWETIAVSEKSRTGLYKKVADVAKTAATRSIHLNSISYLRSSADLLGGALIWLGNRQLNAAKHGDIDNRGKNETK